MTISQPAILSALETHVDRLKRELVDFEKGDIRFGSRKRKGPWEDRTEEIIHDKRNLIATFSAMLRVISTN